MFNQIPVEVHEKNEHIRNALLLESWLVEGSYSKVFEAQKKYGGDDIYTYPMEKLIELTR